MANEVPQRKNIGRIPILPIGYDKVNKAVKGEILVDWETRSLFAKTPEEGHLVLIDNGITKEDNLNGLEFYFGHVSAPFTHRWEVDNESIEYLNRIVQLKDFNNANKYDIPYKDETGNVSWDNRYDVTSSSMKRNPINVPLGVNNLVVLKEGSVCETSGITDTAYIKLPNNTLTVFSRIIWKLVTNDNVDYSFPDDNVTWEKGLSDIFTANSTKVFTFETWDSGATWFGSFKEY